MAIVLRGHVLVCRRRYSAGIKEDHPLFFPEPRRLGGESLGLESPIMTAMMQGPEGFAAALPETYAVLGTGPPAWLIHGDADENTGSKAALVDQLLLRETPVPGKVKTGFSYEPVGLTG